MKVLDFIYNETTISFEPTGNDDVMVNATEMAKAFGREVKDFNKLESTNRFIDACLILCGIESEDNGSESIEISREKRLINGSISDLSSLIKIEKREDLIISRQNSGTWMHRILALKFAAWLDPFFEVWIWAVIDQIILGHYREVKEATFEKLQAEKQLEEKRQELLAKNPEFVEFLAIEGKITDAEKKRLKALRAASDQLKFEFEKKN